MRINQRNVSANQQNVLRQEIARARQSGPLPEPICTPDCPDYNSGTGCDRRCEYAPARLSSEPETYPLESKITPLVFELKKLGIFHPCWSCEGHNDHSGNLWKYPSVWFYSDSVVHVRALANAIEALNISVKLSARWNITLTFSDPDNPDTTFSLEPNLFEREGSLAGLQSDITALAENLERQFGIECSRLERHADGT